MNSHSNTARVLYTHAHMHEVCTTPPYFLVAEGLYRMVKMAHHCHGGGDGHGHDHHDHGEDPAVKFRY